MREEEMKERFGKMGGEVVASSPDEFAEFIKSSSPKWIALAKVAGLQAQ